MKRIFLALALLSSGTAAQASAGHGTHIGCEVRSDYGIGMRGQAFVFTRSDGRPAHVAIGGGKLFVDGREVELSAADRRRIGEFESELRRLLPQVKRIAREAIDIAFTALIEVARGLSDESKATVESLNSARRRLTAELDSKPMALFDDGTIEAVIKPIMTEFVPNLVGSAVSLALQAAFSGEEARKAMELRMQKMERELDAKVEARAKTLEPLAAEMCQGLRRLDGIDNALSYRQADGARLELLSVRDRAEAR